MSGRRRWVVGIVLALLPVVSLPVLARTGPVGDVFAILAPAVVAVVVVGAGAVGWRRRRALVLAGSTAVVGIVVTVAPWVPADTGAVVPGQGVRMVAVNAADEVAAAPGLAALAADVLVVVEMTSDLHPPLARAYRHAHLDLGTPDVAIYSRYPLRAPEPVIADLPGVRIVVDDPGGSFVLYALHVPRPWASTGGPQYQVTVREHRRLVELVADLAAAERGPVAVVGDLNTVDRGRNYRTLLDRGHLVDAMRDGWSAPTSVGKWVPLLLRIDHVLVGAGWCGDYAGRRSVPGTDHLAVEVTIGPCARSSPAGV